MKKIVKEIILSSYDEEFTSFFSSRIAKDIDYLLDREGVNLSNDEVLVRITILKEEE